MPKPQQSDQQPRRTGLVCPACRQPVALIENRLPHSALFYCPGCEHRWSADEPDAPKH